MVFGTNQIMASRSSLRFSSRILSLMALICIHTMPGTFLSFMSDHFQICPGCVFTKYCSNRNRILRLQEFVYTSAGFFLIIFITSCRTPSQSVWEEGTAHLEQQSKEHENTQLDDTTTITHKRIDSTSTVTQIIRKIIYDKDRSAQSLQDSSYQSSRRVEDTLTPALISTISKGFAVACIGLGLMMLGFFVVVVILIFRLSKGT